MSEPVRLQLSRRKGFDLQALSQTTNGLPAVNVARPSRWGNPFVIGKDVGSAAEAVKEFRDLTATHPSHIVPLTWGTTISCETFAARTLPAGASWKIPATLMFCLIWPIGRSARR